MFICLSPCVFVCLCSLVFVFVRCICVNANLMLYVNLVCVYLCMYVPVYVGLNVCVQVCVRPCVYLNGNLIIFIVQALVITLILKFVFPFSRHV